MDSREPEYIGKYAIRRTMGKGAMGVVYEGFDPHIERKVAIKCLHPNLVAADKEGQFLLRFKQEAQAAARCSHPNIVAILEYGELEKNPYIVMEYVEGVNLQDLLQQGRIKHLKNVVSYTGQLLNALHEAHDQRVIHRDIKPANVLVMNNGTVKLADFGIARLPTDQFLTQAGIAVGTPRYMSPEQAMAQPTDHRADLYSLTMMFAEMLTALTLDKSVVADSIPNIDGLSNSHFINNSVPVPAAFIPILIKGLSLSPDKRIQTARDYLDILKSAVDSLKKPVTIHQELPEDATVIVPRRRFDTPSVSANTIPELNPESSPISQIQPTPASTQTVGPHDLQTMQTILTSYIGPIAQNIVQNEANKHQGRAEFARAISSEIDDPQERAAFIRDWTLKSGLSTAERSARSDTSTLGGSSLPFLTDTVRKDLVTELAQHVGPLASRLVAMHESECGTISELIGRLIEEIDGDEDRLQFEMRLNKL